MARAGQIMRPAVFNINHFAPLGRGLVFAGLGCGPGAVQFNDSSINGNNGTLTNMVPADDWVNVPELGRKALEFDGSDRVAITGTQLGFSGDITMAAWLASTDTSTYETIIGAYLLSGAYSGYAFTMNAGGGGSGTLGYWSSTKGSWVSSTGTVNSGNWTHAAVSVRGLVASFYINGALDVAKASAGAGAWTGTTRNIGADTAGGQTFHGQIADPCLWNRALSPHEVAAMADPSNTLLEVGGQPLIWTPRAMSYFYAKAPAAGGATPWLYRPINSQTIGVCA